MNNDERQLISGLFERMQQVGAIDKDRDAEALIGQSLRQNPDAPYLLVQSVLVQEHALQEADRRIQELEQQIADLQRGGARQASGQASGGFLGGMAASAPRTGSVPAAGGRVSPGFGSGAGPQAAPAAQGARPGAPWAGRSGSQQPAAGGGGFFKQAMATAAGVAGGMLLASSISSMLGGGSGTAEAAGATTTAADAAQDTQPAVEHDASGDSAAVDDGMMDAGWGEGLDAGDMGGFDLDI